MNSIVYRRTLAFLLAAVMALACGVAAAAREQSPELNAAGIIHDTKFGGFYADISIEDFNSLGFAYGDSVDLKFSNGCELKDIPYYNGYYTRTGEALICAYPGYPHIKICQNNGEDLYTRFELDESSTVTICLNHAGKYLAIQQTMDTVYSNSRDDFSSDAVFANFRAMSGGRLKPDRFFRSASPVDDQYDRAKYADALMAQYGIALVLDLADSREEYESYRYLDNFDSPWAESLADSGRYIFLDMSAAYRSEDFMQKAAAGLTAAARSEGPFLLHCTEGKDRTGFAAILIEALCGAGYDELLADYMITYDNYYGINADSAPEQYQAIVNVKFNDMVLWLAGADTVEALADIDLSAKAAAYLLAGGMLPEDIELLVSILTE